MPAARSDKTNDKLVVCVGGRRVNVEGGGGDKKYSAYAGPKKTVIVWYRMRGTLMKCNHGRSCLSDALWGGF